jgi:hypothetical protein
VEAVHVDNTKLLHFKSSEVILVEPEIWWIDCDITVETDWTDNNLPFQHPGGSSGCYGTANDNTNLQVAMPTASWPGWASTELGRFDMWTNNDDGFDDQDGEVVDADMMDNASQANDGSFQDADNWGHRSFEQPTSDIDR